MYGLNISPLNNRHLGSMQNISEEKFLIYDQEKTTTERQLSPYITELFIVVSLFLQHLEANHAQ